MKRRFTVPLLGDSARVLTKSKHTSLPAQIRVVGAVSDLFGLFICSGSHSAGIGSQVTASRTGFAETQKCALPNLGVSAVDKIGVHGRTASANWPNGSDFHLYVPRCR